MQIKIPEQLQPTRLDLVVTKYHPSISRTKVRQLLDSGKVSVNGKVEYRPNFRLKEESVIDLDLLEDEFLTNIAAASNEIDLKAAYSDSTVEIFIKPVGINSHPINKNDTQSLLNYISKQYGYSGRLVNRLDKYTGGLIIVAKDSYSAWYYTNQLIERKIIKKYFALVESEYANSFNTKYTYKGLMPDTDKYSETTFEISKVTNKYCVLSCTLHTGRQHQIRVHLSNMGFPIVGDVEYGSRFKNTNLKLFSHYLKFTNMEGKEIKIDLPIPSNFLNE